MTEPWVIALAVNGAASIGLLWSFSLRMTWRAGVEKAKMNETINAHADDNGHEFFKVRKEMERNDHNFAETVSALKQRINDVQLETAKTYVNNDGLKDAVQHISDTISVFRSEIRSDLRRLEQKLDTKTPPASYP